MAKLYVICGHGAGDPGACANGYSEAERVRALGARIAELGGDEVCLLDTSRDWYADGGINSLSIPSDSCLVELHMDSASASARGGHVIIASGAGGADAYDRALADFIAGVFPGRSQTIVERSDLANPNRALSRGINYRLVENGFITNIDDVLTFNNRMDEIAQGYLSAFGIEGGDGMQPVDVWAYKNEEVNGSKDAYQLLTDMHEALVPYMCWQYSNEEVNGDQDAYQLLTDTVKGVRELQASVAALSAAVKALAEANGADPDEIAEAVSAAVKEKLESIDLSVTVG